MEYQYIGIVYYKINLFKFLIKYYKKYVFNDIFIYLLLLKIYLNNYIIY